MARTGVQGSSRGTAFAPERRGARQEAIGPLAWIGLGVTPLAILLGHLAFGVSTNLAACVFTALAGGGLAVGLALPSARAGLAGVRGLGPAAALFAATLGVAALTLTALTPGGPHPVWEWAGMTTRASTINRFQTTIEMIKLAGLACVFLIGAMQAARGDRARATVRALLVLGGIYAAVSLIAFLTGGQVLRVPRLSGGFMSANSGATVFGLLTVLGLAEARRSWRRHGADRARSIARAAPMAALTALFATCLMLTASRAGAASTAAAIAVLMLWDAFASGRRLSARGLIIAAAVMLAGLFLISGAGDRLWLRFDALEQDAVVRRVILDEHWEAFLASPLFGYGLGSFVDLNAMIMTPGTFGNLLVGSAHNVYLQWLEEAGVVGAAPMFALIAFIILTSAWRAGTSHRGGELARGLVAANLVVLLHGLTDFALQEFSIAAMWAFLLGLQFAWGQSSRSQSGRAQGGREGRS